MPRFRLWLHRRFAFRLVAFRLAAFPLAAFVVPAAVASAVCMVVCTVVWMTAWPVEASEPFPFGSELMLDAAPMHGSRRVPMIEIEDDGTASIDLWCASLKAQATINNAALTIVPGDAQPAQCDPDRQARDADLLAALTQVTGWRKSGDVIELTGATPLRFRLMTN
jgi:heat shock protein HslJ